MDESLKILDDMVCQNQIWNINLVLKAYSWSFIKALMASNAYAPIIKPLCYSLAHLKKFHGSLWMSSFPSSQSSSPHGPKGSITN